MSEEGSETTALTIQELRRRLDSHALPYDSDTPCTAVAAANTGALRSIFETFADWLSSASGGHFALPFGHVYRRKIDRSSRSGLACLETPEVGRQIYEYSQETPYTDGHPTEWPDGMSSRGCIDFLPTKAPTATQFCDFVHAGLSSSKPMPFASRRVGSIIVSDTEGFEDLMNQFESLKDVRRYAPNLRSISVKGTERPPIDWMAEPPAVDITLDDKSASRYADLTETGGCSEAALWAARWGLRFSKVYRTSQNGRRVGPIPASWDKTTSGHIHTLIVGGPDRRSGPDEVCADLESSLSHVKAAGIPLPRNICVDIDSSDLGVWDQAVAIIRDAYTIDSPLLSLTLGGSAMSHSSADILRASFWSQLDRCRGLTMCVDGRQVVERPEPQQTSYVAGRPLRLRPPSSLRRIELSTTSACIDTHEAVNFSSGFDKINCDILVSSRHPNAHSHAFEVDNSYIRMWNKYTPRTTEKRSRQR